MTLAAFDRLPSDERDYWVADWYLTRLECSQHGGPLSECSDPEKAWFPQRRVCRATMEADAARAFYDKRHERAKYHDGTFPADLKAWSSERTREHPYRYDEGVTIYAAPEDLNPDDDFLAAAATRSDDEPEGGDQADPR